MKFSAPTLAALSAALSLTNALPLAASTALRPREAFNAVGSSNLAAWWGQTAAASSVPLSKLCSDPSFDIIIISFLNYIRGPGNAPKLNFGPAGQQPSVAQSAAGATGLMDLSKTMGKDVETCHKNGKKVFLSVGGAQGYADSTFQSDAEATKFADTVYDLFLGGKSELRPFGADVVLDGIDIDNESGSHGGWTAFVTQLRKKIDADKAHQFYISAAPQCVYPDASIPMDAMKLMDFVWVQHYNNGACNHGAGDSFIKSVQQWSDGLKGGKAKYMIAAIADKSQGTGLVSADELAKEIAKVQALKLPNFGGYALWDGSEAMANGNMQKTVKQALCADSSADSSAVPKGSPETTTVSALVPTSTPAAASTPTAKSSHAAASTLAPLPSYAAASTPMANSSYAATSTPAVASTLTLLPSYTAASVPTAHSSHAAASTFGVKSSHAATSTLMSAPSYGAASTLASVPSYGAASTPTTGSSHAAASTLALEGSGVVASTPAAESSSVAASTLASLPSYGAAPSSTPVAASGTDLGSCSANGALVCSSDGSQFGICNNGSTFMMAVATGTKCSGGSIIAA